MSTVQELKKRADELRNKTAVNSITPDEVGSLIFDTIDYMYSIESSGIFKMMSSLADTTNPSAADQIPVIGAEIAQKASITTVVGKGLQNAETQTELDSVPVIRGTKVGQMAKSDIAVKLCESFEQNLPTYRPNTDTFDQIRIRKSETGESYYISKEDLAEVVGGLIGEATQNKDGLMSKEYTIYNEAETTGLNFNSLKNLFRLYCSYGGTNSPVGGAYYWGIVNIGWNYGHFVQLACRTLDDGNSAIYARAYNEPRFTPWKEIISFTM